MHQVFPLISDILYCKCKVLKVGSRTRLGFSFEFLGAEYHICVVL